MREGLGITIRASSQSSIGIPQTRPMGTIDTSVPLRHTINFQDMENPTKGKPQGVKGAEIWCKLGGEATMNEDGYKYCATGTASPDLMIHKSEDIRNRLIICCVVSIREGKPARGAVRSARRLRDKSYLKNRNETKRMILR